MRKSPYLLFFALVIGPVVAQEMPDATALGEGLQERAYTSPIWFAPQNETSH